LGSALATVFANRGYGLVLNCRDPERPFVGGAQCDIVPGDLHDDDVIKALIMIAAERNISIIINDAAIYQFCHSPSDLNRKEIQDIIEVNLIAPIKLTLGLWPFLKKNHGTVVNINSIAGRRVGEGEYVYSASKFGLTGFSTSLQAVGIRDGVRVVDLPLGAMRTDMTKGRAKWDEYPDPSFVAELIFEICADDHAYPAAIDYDVIFREGIIDNGKMRM
jgi:short-subunit dehydrogenase